MLSCSVPCRRTRYRYVRWTAKGLSWQRCRLTSGRNVCGFLVELALSLLHEVPLFVPSVGCSRLTRSFPGRIWSLTFFSPPSTTRTAVGMWQVALCLLEHSPPTFIDSRLVIDIPPTSPNASQASDLISLSPPPSDPSSPAARSPPPPSPPLSNKSKSKSKAPQNIEVRLKSGYRLAYRASNTFLAALDAAFSSQKGWSPPQVEQWTDNNGSTYTGAIVVPLDDGAGAELLYA